MDYGSESRGDNEHCTRSKAIHTKTEVIISEVGQLVLAIITLILLKIAILSYYKYKIALHRNLMLLVGNIAFLYAFHSMFIIILQARYLLLLWFSTDPCDFLTPVWLNFVLRMPTYVYVTAYTLSHFALTTERTRATFFAKSYEKEGAWYPIICLIILWTLTVIINGILVILALQDPSFQRPMAHVSLTVETNASLNIYLHLIGLVFVIITSVMDYWLLVKNRKNRVRNSISYTLSRTYQIKENIVIMSLIWPLDVCYAIVFILFLVIASLIRLIGRQATSDKNKFEKFLAYNDFLYMIIPMHSIVTLLLYLRFVKKCKSRTANGVIAEPEDPARLYFEQLRSQWGTEK